VVCGACRTYGKGWQQVAFSSREKEEVLIPLPTQEAKSGALRPGAKSCVFGSSGRVLRQRADHSTIEHTHALKTKTGAVFANTPCAKWTTPMIETANSLSAPSTHFLANSAGASDSSTAPASTKL
jgi:hypothetical protein